MLPISLWLITVQVFFSRWWLRGNVKQNYIMKKILKKKIAFFSLRIVKWNTLPTIKPHSVTVASHICSKLTTLPLLVLSITKPPSGSPSFLCQAFFSFLFRKPDRKKFAVNWRDCKKKHTQSALWKKTKTSFHSFSRTISMLFIWNPRTRRASNYFLRLWTWTMFGIIWIFICELFFGSYSRTKAEKNFYHLWSPPKKLTLEYHIYPTNLCAIVLPGRKFYELNVIKKEYAKKHFNGKIKQTTEES